MDWLGTLGLEEQYCDKFCVFLFVCLLVCFLSHTELKLSVRQTCNYKGSVEYRPGRKKGEREGGKERDREKKERKEGRKGGRKRKGRRKEGRRGKAFSLWSKE